MQIAVPKRLDLYAVMHKGLAACMHHVLGRVGRVDPTDPAEVHAVVEEGRDLLRLCRMHLRQEEEIIHVVMEARWPGSSIEAAAGHAEHVAAIDRLDQRFWALDESDLTERVGIVRQVYAALGLFVADNLAHMHHEETAHNRVLWACYSDVELAAVHRRLVAAGGAVASAAVERWVLPAVTPAERAAMVAGMQRNGDRAAVVDLVRRARPRVSARDWAKLEAVFAL
jgi:hypothetical protein